MRKNRNRPESDEPLSEGRVEYLEAARQRVRNRRIRRTAVLLVLLTAVVLFATGIAGSSVAALKDLTDTARIALLPGSGWPQQTGVAELEQMATWCATWCSSRCWCTSWWARPWPSSA